jgi:hypothetical protein
MKRLKTTETGGHPFTLDDLGFIQDASADALKQLLTAFNDANDTVILSGCVVSYTSSNTIINITAGFISYKGEVCPVDAGSFTVAGTIPGFKPLAISIPPSAVVYENLISKDVHTLKGCLFVDITSEAESVALSLVKRIEEVIQKKIEAVGEWRTVPLNGSSEADKYTANYTQPSSIYTFAKYRKHGNKVEFYGAFQFSTMVEASTVWTLPVGSRPLKLEVRAAPVTLAGGGAKMIYISIQTTGEVSLFSMDDMVLPGSGTAKVVDVSEISFYVE